MNINEQARDIHRRNYKWWHDKNGNRLERNRGELLMLVVSELSEAMEALRKDLWDDKLPHRKGEEVELADAYIRLLDYAEGMGIPLRSKLGVRSPVEENRAEALFDIVRRVTDIEYGLDYSVSFRVEDALSSILDYAHHYNLDLQGAVAEKLAYNDTREDHTWEAREAANGKKF